MMDTKEIFERSRQEILNLRRENEILRAKVEMIDLFACVLHSEPARHGGGAMHPDIAYELGRALDQLGSTGSGNG